MGAAPKLAGVKAGMVAGRSAFLLDWDRQEGRTPEKRTLPKLKALSYYPGWSLTGGRPREWEAFILVQDWLVGNDGIKESIWEKCMCEHMHSPVC